MKTIINKSIRVDPLNPDDEPQYFCFSKEVDLDIVLQPGMQIVDNDQEVKIQNVFYYLEDAYFAIVLETIIEDYTTDKETLIEFEKQNGWKLNAVEGWDDEYVENKTLEKMYPNDPEY